MNATDKQFFKDLLAQDPGNKRCIDCDTAHPQWASISYGTYFCLNCSGKHRSLGVHISFVRSVSMDTWSDKQKAMMKLGGNTRFKEFAEKHQIDQMDINTKYQTKAAEWYRNTNKARYEGATPEAEPAVGVGKDSTQGSSSVNKNFSGIGSSANSSSRGNGGSGGGGSQSRTGFGSSSMSGIGNPNNSVNSNTNSNYGLSYQGNNNTDFPFNAQNVQDVQENIASGFWGAVSFAGKVASKVKDQAEVKESGLVDTVRDNVKYGFDTVKETGTTAVNTIGNEDFFNKVGDKVKQVGGAAIQVGGVMATHAKQQIGSLSTENSFQQQSGNQNDEWHQVERPNPPPTKNNSNAFDMNFATSAQTTPTDTSAAVSVNKVQPELDLVGLGSDRPRIDQNQNNDVAAAAAGPVKGKVVSNGGAFASNNKDTLWEDMFNDFDDK